MNKFTQKLLNLAIRGLPDKKRTKAELIKETERLWIIWRDDQIEAWADAFEPVVQRRPASDYYPDTPLGNKCLDWIDNNGFYWWELPAYDGEDDEFVYRLVAHSLAVWTWLAFEFLWPQLDYTEAELEAFFNFKKAYAPPPGDPRQMSLF